MTAVGAFSVRPSRSHKPAVFGTGAADSTRRGPTAMRIEISTSDKAVAVCTPAHAGRVDLARSRKANTKVRRCWLWVAPDFGATAHEPRAGGFDPICLAKRDV